MAQTPQTGATPYLTAARFWLYRDIRPVLELLADDDTIPTQADAEDSTTDAGGRLAASLARASGDVEMYAQLGNRYKAEDLAAIVTGAGNGRAALEGLVADLAMWSLAKRRWPRMKPEEVAGAAEALELLKMLRDGEAIFGLAESAAAGVAETIPIHQLNDPNLTVTEARRFFGRRRTRNV